MGEGEIMINKEEFVNELGKLLNMAKPHLVKCELVKGSDIFVDESRKKYEAYVAGGDYVVVTCENGYSYKIDVTGNSLIAIATEVLNKMVNK